MKNCILFINNAKWTEKGTLTINLFNLSIKKGNICHAANLLPWVNWTPCSILLEYSDTIHYQNSEGSEDDLGLPSLDLSTIVNATKNFSTENKIGEGGFGPVYKVIQSL